MCRKLIRNLRRSDGEVKCKVSQGKWSTKECVYNERGGRKRFIFRNWLVQLWGLATLKSVEKASRLEVQGRASVAGLSAKRAGQANRISVQATFLSVSRQNSSLSRKLRSLPLGPSSD